MINVADVVVIGGGVHGATTAFHLARSGAGRVVLVEKSQIASGPTAKSGAMIRCIFTEETYIQLVTEALAMFEHWDDVVGGDPGFVECGFLRFTRTLDPAETGGDLQLMRRQGVPFELLDVDALRSRVPNADFRGDEQGVWLPRSGYADPVRTTRTLASAAVRHGATILESVQVTGIRVRGTHIESVETDRGPIATRTVVNCAGPWSARLAASVGVSLPIEAHRTATSLFHRPPAIPAGGPILSDGVNQVYLRQVSDSLVRVAHFGWTRQQVSPDDYDETISMGQLSALRADLAKRYRSMQREIFAGGFSAIYDMTPDAHPIIGPVGDVEGFWCNCGWSGNGFASAAAVGRHIAARIGGRQSEVDLGTFAWPRPSATRPRIDGNWVRR